MSKFIKIKCNKCKNEQQTFSKASKDVKCLVCGEVLARSKGGKIEVLGTLIEELK